jgi:hypothetical protein
MWCRNQTVATRTCGVEADRVTEAGPCGGWRRPVRTSSGGGVAGGPGDMWSQSSIIVAEVHPAHEPPDDVHLPPVHLLLLLRDWHARSPPFETPHEARRVSNIRWIGMHERT